MALLLTGGIASHHEDTGFASPKPVEVKTLAALLAGQAPDDYELIRQALILYRAGKCGEAEPLFEKILLRDPKNIAVRKLLGNCYLREKRMDDARTQFQLVLDTAPKDTEAAEGLRASVGEIQKREELKQTLALEAKAATAQELQDSQEFRRAAQLTKARRWGEAEKIIEGIVRRNPASVPARLRLAEIYSATRRHDKAAETYRSLAEKKGAPSATTLRLAQNLDWGGKYAEAAKYYRVYLERIPQDTSARMALANALIWSQRYQEAVPELKQLQSKRPGDLRVPIALAQCYEQLNEPDQALQAYQQVLQLDPTNPMARAAKERYLRDLVELPRRKAFQALEHNDFDGAAQSFAEYLQKHPESTETVLQIARVYGWGQRFPEAVRYTREYLRRKPEDFTVLRELARLELWMRDYESALRDYQQLIQSPAALPDDYEALVNAYSWAGDLPGAESFARKLAQLDPNNRVARQALSDLFERRKLAARTQAEELAAAGRYPDAVAAYQRYMKSYGKTQQLELQIPRLYSYGKDYGHAIEAYQGYLREYPQDLTARLELANAENWASRYDDAEVEYHRVLQADPRNVTALLSVAQITENRGEDPFTVRDRYLDVLDVDPRNSAAERRLEEIHPQLASSLGYSQSSFWDSDGLYWSLNVVEGSLPLPGHVRVTPFYTFGYYHQLRQLGQLSQVILPSGQILQVQPSPEINAINEKIGELNGTILRNGGGARFEMTRGSRWSVLGEGGAVVFSQRTPFPADATPLVRTLSGDRTSVSGRAEITYRAGKNSTLGLTYTHRDAVQDLNTVASLAAGIMGDTLFLSFQQPLSERVRVWVAAGGTHYSRGVDSKFSSTTQRRLSTRLDFSVRPWATLGYSMRLSNFNSPSPLYFSPSLYQTHGLSYALSHAISKRLRASVAGEVSFSRITPKKVVVPTGTSTVVTNCGIPNFPLLNTTTPSGNCSTNAVETAVVPTLSGQVHRSLIFQLGYRFSLGRASSFGSPVYQTSGAEFSLKKLF